MRNTVLAAKELVQLVRKAVALFLVVLLFQLGLMPFSAALLVQAHADEGGAAANAISQVWMVAENTDDAYGYSDNPDCKTLTIDSKGGRFVFDSIVRWTDWSENRDTAYVEWSSDDPSVASINSAGEVTAHADGDTRIKATVQGANTESGSDLVAWCSIHVSGQSDTPYVTSIQIIKADGSSIDGPVMIEQELSTAVEYFAAKVTVVDPATGASTEYNTANGTLSSQTGGAVGDIRWYVGDSAVGDVEEQLGMYRPLRYGTGTLYAESSAGYDGSVVRTSVNITIEDPDGGVQNDGYIPQDSLTIKAYYELYTPEEHGDEAYVINKKYTVDELYGLGTFTQTYTAMGSGNYWTLTGEGVLLSAVLQDAGVNIDGIDQFKFGTADNLDRSVSANYVFDTNRYYFPNIDVNSYAGAVQVAPMLAFRSVEVRNASTEPDTAGMVENTRFRLLFGSTTAGGTSQYQIKWINTIYVVLYGGPSYEDGDGDGGNQGSGTGPGQTTGGGDSSTGAGTTEDGGTSDTTKASVSGDVATNEAQATAPSVEAASEGQEAGGNDPGTAETAGGKFSVYQMMNRNDSDVEDPIEDPDITAYVALPAALLVLVAGGVEYALWFRRQTGTTTQKTANA